VCVSEREREREREREKRDGAPGWSAVFIFFFAGRIGRRSGGSGGDPDAGPARKDPHAP